MPIETRAIAGDVIHTVLTGRVTDDELLAYYSGDVFQHHAGRWLELVDGTRITEMGITGEGQWKLKETIALKSDMLRDGRVAMVAATDATYGMFRMWEMQRESMPYEVRVFRDVNEALAWLKSGEYSAA